jgi:hypothetical protein
MKICACSVTSAFTCACVQFAMSCCCVSEIKEMISQLKASVDKADSETMSISKANSSTWIKTKRTAGEFTAAPSAHNHNSDVLFF